MTLALIIISAAAVLVAIGSTVRHHANRVIREMAEIEQRQIERVQAAGLNANAQARWSR